jgi:hypothetical protein
MTLSFVALDLDGNATGFPSGKGSKVVLGDVELYNPIKISPS